MDDAKGINQRQHPRFLTVLVDGVEVCAQVLRHLLQGSEHLKERYVPIT